MKVYVDELPPNCAYCSFWVGGRCIVDEGSAFCPLEINKIKTQSLADYTKQVRKEVCEEIRNFIEKPENSIYWDCSIYVETEDLRKLLDQIQGVEHGTIDNKER